jgi:hypothetical protein
VTSPSGLQRYDAARHALAEAHRVDEVKDVRDKAMAMRLYALQARDRVLIDQATEIRLRAERRAGELLAEMEKNKGSRGQGRPSKGGNGERPPKDDAPKLSDLGVTKDQSSRWQKLAGLEDEEFEDVVTRARQSAANALDRARANSRPKPKPKPKSKSKSEPESEPKPDPVAACVAEVEAVVRAACAKLTPGAERLVLFEGLERSLRAMRAELEASDDPDRWSES